MSVIFKEEKEYGLVCDLPGHDSYTGLITAAHKPPAAPAPGQVLQAAVLDVHQLDGIVDLAARKVRLTCAALTVAVALIALRHCSRAAQQPNV
jgi:hypothetical protein